MSRINSIGFYNKIKKSEEYFSTHKSANAQKSASAQRALAGMGAKRLEKYLNFQKKEVNKVAVDRGLPQKSMLQRKDYSQISHTKTAPKPSPAKAFDKKVSDFSTTAIKPHEKQMSRVLNESVSKLASTVKSLTDKSEAVQEQNLAISKSLSSISGSSLYRSRDRISKAEIQKALDESNEQLKAMENMLVSILEKTDGSSFGGRGNSLFDLSPESKSTKIINSKVAVSNIQAKLNMETINGDATRLSFSVDAE